MEPHVMNTLLARISNGDLEALEGLYKDFRHAVFSYSLILLRDWSSAEDHVQDVFIRIWEKASTYRPGGNPRVWILGMTHHMAIDRLRKANREVSLDDLAEEDLAASDSIELRAADHMDMQDMLRVLHPQDRQIVLLKAVAGLPLKSIGRLLGLPVSTVHWRYRRSLKQLAQRM
jgi:RNA polymerase sigma-70 factor, ECF subfamily